MIETLEKEKHKKERNKTKEKQ